MLFPTQNTTLEIAPQALQQDDVGTTRLPNLETYSSSHLHRYASYLFAVYKELEGETSIEGVVCNRERFLAAYRDMQKERVPHMDMALLRGATSLKAEHRCKCLSVIANLQRMVSSQQKQGSSKVPATYACLAQSNDGFQARRELKSHYTHVLRSWIESHSTHPFPSKAEKVELCAKASITERQLNNWFTNYRRRHLQTNNS